MSIRSSESLPMVQEFDSDPGNCDKVVQALNQSGGVVIRNLLPQSTLDSIEVDVRPHLDADKPWAGGFFPPETRRAFGLAGKSPAFTNSIVANPLYQAVCNVLLKSTMESYLGQKLQSSVSSPQLNNTIVFSIGPGARSQELHRDDIIHHNSLPEISADDYEIGRDTGIGFFVAGKKTTKANGATRFIPGSHLWKTLEPPNEKLAGKPLAWHEADQAQREKFMRQLLADIYTELEKHPLGALGRLQPSLSSAGQPEVGPAFFDYDSTGRAVPFGPFDNMDDYYKALIQHKIGLIKTGEIAPSAPLDQYLVYKSLLDRLPRSEQGPFFLRHVDSRDANFLVDPDYNITGIIDLELAMVTAKGAAFQSPLLLYDLGELYHEGLSTPSEDEKRLAKILQEETKSDELSALAAQKLHFRVDQVIETSPEDGKNFFRVFSGWWKAATGEQALDWDMWHRNALDKYGDGGFTPSTVK